MAADDSIVPPRSLALALQSPPRRVAALVQHTSVDATAAIRHPALVAVPPIRTRSAMSGATRPHASIRIAPSV